jgi:putative addiction module component (TIGR02574 family)
MPTRLDKIMQESLRLPLEDRAHLVGELLLSIDQPSADEVERLWLDEAEVRLQAYRDGEVKAIPAADVFNRAIEELR